MIKKTWLERMQCALLRSHDLSTFTKPFANSITEGSAHENRIWEAMLYAHRLTNARTGTGSAQNSAIMGIHVGQFDS